MIPLRIIAPFRAFREMRKRNWSNKSLLTWRIFDEIPQQNKIKITEQILRFYGMVLYYGVPRVKRQTTKAFQELVQKIQETIGRWWKIKIEKPQIQAENHCQINFLEIVFI